MIRSVNIEVYVEISDVLNQLDDKDLAAYGLARVSPPQQPGDMPFDAIWRELRTAMQRGDQTRTNDLLADMAWRMGGVILPAGIPYVH